MRECSSGCALHAVGPRRAAQAETEQELHGRLFLIHCVHPASVEDAIDVQKVPTADKRVPEKKKAQNVDVLKQVVKEKPDTHFDLFL